MSLAGRTIARLVAFFRAGYPTGAPATGYVPLLALLRRRVTDDEVTAIISKLTSRQPSTVGAADAPGAVDVGVEITHITDELPAPDDVERVQQRFRSAKAQDDPHRPPGTV